MDIREFTVGEQTFLVKAPSSKDQQEAGKIYNTAFSSAIKSKALVRAKLDDVLTDQGLWDDAKQKKYENLQNEILEGERALSKGGIPLKKAKSFALKMKTARNSLRDLISVKTTLDTHTAEGQADNARFNYLVSACLVYKDTKQPYFQGYEDYLSKAGELVAIEAAQHLASMLYGLENDYEQKLPENKFLSKYNFVDDKLRLIDDKGQLVDDSGRLINEAGRFVNEKGELVDKKGNLVNDKGDYLVEFQPFLDDSGKPIGDSNNEKKEEQNGTDKKPQNNQPKGKPQPANKPEK